MFLASVGLISTVGNILIIYVIRQSRELTHSQYVYKTSIAVCGVIWSSFLFFIFGFVSYTFLTPNIGMKCGSLRLRNNLSDVTVANVSCHLFARNFTEQSSMVCFLIFVGVGYFLAMTSFTASFVTLVFAAGDRFFALAFPNKYRKTNAVKTAENLSVFTWILSTLVTVVTVYRSQNDACQTLFLQPAACDSSQQNFVSVLLLVSFTLLWLFTLLTLKSLHKGSKRSSELVRRKSKKVDAEKETSFVLIFMVFAFTFSLSPTLYNHIKHNVSKQNYEKFQRTFDLNQMVAVCFLSTNSIWNVLIYIVLSKKIRLGLKALFKNTR